MCYIIVVADGQFYTLQSIVFVLIMYQVIYDHYKKELTVQILKVKRHLAAFYLHLPLSKRHQVLATLQQHGATLHKKLQKGQKVTKATIKVTKSTIKVTKVTKSDKSDYESDNKSDKK